MSGVSTDVPVEHHTPTDGSLAPLSLSDAAVAVYERMLLDDQWSLSTLPGSLGVSRDELASALDELVAAQLIVRTEDSPTMRVVSPQVGLSRLLEVGESELRRRHEELATARRVAQNLISRAEEAREVRSRTTLEIVTAPAEIANAVSEVLEQARHEVSTMLTILPSPQSLSYAAGSDAALLARGVGTRLLVLEGHLTRSPELVAHVERLVGLGAQVRVATTLPHRMIVVDGRTAVLPADLRDESSAALVTRQPTIVSLALDAFEHVWGNSQEYTACADDGQSDVAREDGVPSRLQREVLHLLASGEKDETVARRLGVSARTVRRLIAEISESLGVTSRFQLAVEATRRNLV